MRPIRTAAATAMAGLALGCLTATTAAAAEPPTGIQLSWADTGEVRVTWQEATPTANVIQAEHVSGGAVTAPITVSADAPNEVLLPASAMAGWSRLWITVSSGTATDSPRGYSAEFDSTLPPAPVVTSATGTYGAAATVSWRPGDSYDDSTPDDPLDQPGQPILYRLGWRYPGEAGWGPIGEFTDATTATGVPSLPERRNYHLVVLTSANEWGPANPESPRSIVAVSAATTSPRFTTLQRIDGTLELFRCNYGCGPDIGTVTQAGRQIVLQHRTAQGQPWQRIRSVNTALDGTYRFTNVPLTGDLRVVVPPAADVTAVHNVYPGLRTAVLYR